MLPVQTRWDRRRPMFKVIVCATDGSETADRGLPFARELASGDGCTLVVVHAKEHNRRRPAQRVPGACRRRRARGHGRATRVIAPARRRCAVKPAARMGSWWPMADRAHGVRMVAAGSSGGRCPADRSPRPVDAAVGPAQRADVALPLVQRFVRAGWDRERPAEVVDRFESLASHPVRQVVEEHGCVFGTVP
jgi:nucleotide-binding universal stress UspA family protein